MTSLSGFVIISFIFLSMLEATIAENSCNTGCASNEIRYVCKGDSTILDIKDLIDTSFDPDQIEIRVVKLINSRTGCSGERKGNSSKIELKNIEENDTGTYKFRLSGSNDGLKLAYCAELKISCEHLTVPSGSNVNLTCKVSEDGAKLKNTVNWYYKSESMAIGKKFLASFDIRTHTVYTLSQLKKSDSGNYTCSRESMDQGTSKKHYIYVLKVHEPQLITTTKETPSQTGKPSSQLSSLPTAAVVPSTKETPYQRQRSSQYNSLSTAVIAPSTKEIPSQGQYSSLPTAVIAPPTKETPSQGQYSSLPTAVIAPSTKETPSQGQYSSLPTVVSVPTTKETLPQAKRSSPFSSLSRVFTVPTSMIRKEAKHMSTTKEKETESLPNFTKLRTKETLDPTSKTEEAVPLTGDIAVVNKVKGEKATIPNSTGTRSNSALSVLVLSQSYIWIWKMWNYY